MNRLNQAFAALADPTRRGIVVHLARGEASVSDLVGLFSLKQPTISSHLKVLESGGLISRGRVAQSRPCKLETQQLKAVTDWLDHVQEVWEGNFKRLDALLAELKHTERGAKQMKPAEVSTPSDREVLVKRSFDAPVNLVWQAYTEPALMRRWLSGPPGWSMPVCEMATRWWGSTLALAKPGTRMARSLGSRERCRRRAVSEISHIRKSSTRATW